MYNNKLQRKNWKDSKMKKEILRGISITVEVILGVIIPLFLFLAIVCSDINIENQIDQCEEKIEIPYTQLNKLKNQ